MSLDVDLLKLVRAALKAQADPERARGAQAYMKSAMPYYGVRTPVMRRAVREIFAAHPIATADEWRDAFIRIWRGATHREERYAAIELALFRSYRDYQTMDTLPLYEEMIVAGAWWDYVDQIASGLLGGLLRRYPPQMKKKMLAWAKCDLATPGAMWKRRAAILCQLSFKQETDLGLLYACIEPSAGSSEFFLRKGIGWALRQYAWSDPKEIRRYVLQNEKRLSPLTRREALKNIGL